MQGATTRDILGRLKNTKADVIDLLGAYHTRAHEELWLQDARLYRAFADELIHHGHPTLAVELVREAFEKTKGPNATLRLSDDPHLKYLIALGYARGGNATQAEEYLARLEPVDALAPELAEHALCLHGSLYKDRYMQSERTAEQRRSAKESTAFYKKAFKRTRGLFPLINWATMSLLSGEKKLAHRLARKAHARAMQATRQAGASRDRWLPAVIAEALLIQRELDEAITWYREAVGRASAAGKVGDIAAMRRNALLLKPKLGLTQELWQTLSLGNVVAFAGHMLDRPSDGARQALRFPRDPAMERLVRTAIANAMDKLNVRVGFCSAACGSDILFAELMQSRDFELHVVLPFRLDDFYHTSVHFGLDDSDDVWREWRQRCDLVLARSRRANRLHFATREPFLGDQVLFEFVNTFTQGLAINRARELGIDPWAIVVLDPDSPLRHGGTRYFLERWQKKMQGRNCEVIDLQGVRELAGLPRNSVAPAVAPASSELRRQVKAMLFADVKGSSKVPEERSPLFAARFLGKVKDVVDATRPRPRFVNTAGDGVTAVFDSVRQAADFAWRLMDQMGTVNWGEFGFTERRPIRVALHAGPVYEQRDPVIKKTNYFGGHMNFAARLEPSTMPGCIFTSAQFAAALAVETGHHFVCEVVGVAELPKDAGRHPLYRLERRPAQSARRRT